MTKRKSIFKNLYRSEVQAQDNQVVWLGFCFFSFDRHFKIHNSCWCRLYCDAIVPILAGLHNLNCLERFFCLSLQRNRIPPHLYAENVRSNQSWKCYITTVIGFNLFHILYIERDWKLARMVCLSTLSTGVDSVQRLS